MKIINLVLLQDLLTAGMLKNVGAKYVILGHSENRKEGETNLKIKKKIESAI